MSAAQNADYALTPEGNARCNTPVVEWDYGDDGIDRLAPGSPYPCDADLYVTWAFTCPIGPGDRIEKADVPSWAVSSSWQLACANGHVLRMSGNQWTTADDAEPAVFDVLFPPAHIDGSGAVS